MLLPLFHFALPSVASALAPVRRTVSDGNPSRLPAPSSNLASGYRPRRPDPMVYRFPCVQAPHVRAPWQHSWRNLADPPVLLRQIQHYRTLSPSAGQHLPVSSSLPKRAPTSVRGRSFPYRGHVCMVHTYIHNPYSRTTRCAEPVGSRRSPPAKFPFNLRYSQPYV